MTEPPPLRAPTQLDLSRPINPLRAEPGVEIVLRGSFQSTHDGSIVDAATTSWSGEAPGGASVDAGGLVDFAQGGLHMLSRDPVTHEVHAIVTGQQGPACTAAGLTSPCLPLRLQAQGNTRLMTTEAWQRSLKGAIVVEVPESPLLARELHAIKQRETLFGCLGAAVVVGAAGALLWRRHKQQRSSPRAQLAALARRVREKAERADPIVAAPLLPALDGAIARIDKGRIDPLSSEAKRVSELLSRVDGQLDQTAERLHARSQREVTDELVREVESALEAVDETLSLSDTHQR